VAAPESGSLWLPAGAATNFSRRLFASPGVRGRASPSRRHTVATFGSSLPLDVRPPRRPRDVRVLPLSVGKTKRRALPVTFATWSNKVLSRPRAAPNTPDSGSLHERSGESSTASSTRERGVTPSGARSTCPSRDDPHLEQGGTAGLPGGDPSAVAHGSGRRPRHSKMTGTSSPAFNPSPSRTSASPLAAAIPDSTLLPCKPWRSQTYRPPRTWTLTRSR